MSKAVSLRVAAATALRWSVGARFATQVIRWGATLVVIRLLAPADYGLLAMVMAIVSVAAMFNELGASSVIIRSPNLSKSEIGSIQGFVFLLNFLLAGLLFVAAPLASTLYGQDITLLIRVSCSLFAFYSIGIVQEALLIRAMDFKSRALVETTAQLLGAGVTLTLAIAGHGVWALVLGMITGQAVRAFGFLRLVPERYPLRLVPSDLRPHALFAGAMSLQRFVSGVAPQFNRAVIGWLHGPGPLGLYYMAGDLAYLPSKKMGSVLNQVGFSVYAKTQYDVAKIGHALHNAIGMLVLIFFPYTLLVIALASEGVTVILGEQWSSMTRILQIVALGLPMGLANVQIYEALNASGHAGPVLRIQLRNKIVSSVLIIGGASISLELAALGALGGLVLAHMAYLRCARNMLDLAIKPLLSSYLAPATAGCVGLLAVSIMRISLDGALAPSAMLATLAVVGSVVTLASLLLLAHARCQRLLAFARAK